MSFAILLTITLAFGQNPSAIPRAAGGGSPTVVARGFVPPVADYLEQRHAELRFGEQVEDAGSPFSGQWCLGDAVDVAADTEVRAVADGQVVYSDWIPAGAARPDLGGVVIIEHDLGKDAPEPRVVCSVYAQLSRELRVTMGDRVSRGDVLGTVAARAGAKDDGHPARFHFALHQGEYFAISPSWERQVREEARLYGLPFGPDDAIVQGEVAFARESDTAVRVTFVETGYSGPLSLRVEYASPEYTPAAIVRWCATHGERSTRPEWLDPAAWFSAHPATDATEDGKARHFSFPCDHYVAGLKRRRSFGAKVPRGNSVFGGSYHLAEDIWLAPGTEVHSIGNGVVVYSDFSPTWKDRTGHTHWNFGNVIVIEHELAKPEGDLAQVCSVYVHLSAERRVRVGDRVERGQLIGFIGADRSEENGRYPAHLHFGIHQGPYYQISPGWKKDLEDSARKPGLPFGPENRIVRGDITITRTAPAEVLVEFVGQDAKATLSLLAGSTSPDYHPADIMAWCQGYGTKGDIDEWLQASTWIRARQP